jgi:hypothetical protein
MSTDVERSHHTRVPPTWQSANTVALIEGPPIVLNPPNTVLQRDRGDR